MSYGVDIGDRSFNYTYNVSSLFYDHIPQDTAHGGLSEIDGKTGAQARKILDDCFDRIDRTRIGMSDAPFRVRYDAPNGWGTTIGAIIFLAGILAACAEHPRKRVRVS